MRINILKSDDFKTTNWGDGTTTELFIHPKNTELKKLNFDFRLSKAVVLKETSKFSTLPGVHRKLMVLNGKITLNHKNHHSKTVEKFEIDAFQGDWDTTSNGLCSDFNLMTTKEKESKLYGLSLPNSSTSTHVISKNLKWFFMYIEEGSLTLNTSETSFEAFKGDLCAITDFNTTTNITIKTTENSELVFVEIGKNTHKAKL